MHEIVLSPASKQLQPSRSDYLFSVDIFTPIEKYTIISVIAQVEKLLI